jgi:hypothetical protein
MVCQGEGVGKLLIGTLLVDMLLIAARLGGGTTDTLLMIATHLGVGTSLRTLLMGTILIDTGVSGSIKWENRIRLRRRINLPLSSDAIGTGVI